MEPPCVVNMCTDVCVCMRVCARACVRLRLRVFAQADGTPVIPESLLLMDFTP